MSMNENSIRHALSPKDLKKKQIDFYDMINNENMDSLDIPMRN